MTTGEFGTSLGGNSSQGATERSSEHAHSILGDPGWTAHSDRLFLNGLCFVVS